MLLRLQQNFYRNQCVASVWIQQAGYSVQDNYISGQTMSGVEKKRGVNGNQGLGCKYF